MALPVLALLAGALLCAVLAAAAKIRCVDAAREGARAAARGDPAEEAARAAAPGGAEVGLEREGTLIRVRVSAPVAGALPMRVSATAVAEAEEDGS